MNKRIYTKPEIEVIEMPLQTTLICSSWTMDGKKDGTDGGEIIEGNPEGGLDSRKNDSGWDFEW